MRIIPVLDLKGGQVVRGVAGRRKEYRPVVSRLTDSSRPADIARAFGDRLGLTELYLADLDAIGGAPPALGVYDAVRALGCRLWVDAGVRQASQVSALATAGVDQVVVGLETAAGPEVLEQACREVGAGRVVFSLDLKGGQPLGNAAAWGSPDPWFVALRAARAGVRRVIVLDLAHVGVGAGVGTEALCRRLAASQAGLEVVAGGGVRGTEDLNRLRECGVWGVLVASALHDGSLGAEQLRQDRVAGPER